MKKENFNPLHKFFLFSNGDVIFAPEGLSRKDYFIDQEKNVKVLAFEVNEDGNIKRNVPTSVVYATDSITAIEEKEKSYFLNTRKKINYYFKNLIKEDHNYKPEDMDEHIQKLIDANRSRIIRRWKISEDKELKKMYGNTFNM